MGPLASPAAVGGMAGPSHTWCPSLEGKLQLRNTQNQSEAELATISLPPFSSSHPCSKVHEGSYQAQGGGGISMLEVFIVQSNKALEQPALMVVFTPQARIWPGDPQKSFPTTDSPQRTLNKTLSSPRARAHLTPTIPSVTALMSQYKGGTQPYREINEAESAQAVVSHPFPDAATRASAAPQYWHWR